MKEIIILNMIMWGSIVFGLIFSITVASTIPMVVIGYIPSIASVFLILGLCWKTFT